MPARTPEPQTCRHVSAGMGASFSGKTATPLHAQQMVQLRGRQHAQQQGLQPCMALLEDSLKGLKVSTAMPRQAFQLSTAWALQTHQQPCLQGCWRRERVAASGWWHHMGSWPLQCTPSVSSPRMYPYSAPAC